MTNPRGSWNSITRPFSGPLVTVNATFILAGPPHSLSGLFACRADCLTVLLSHAVLAVSVLTPRAQLSCIPHLMVRAFIWLDLGSLFCGGGYRRLRYSG